MDTRILEAGLAAVSLGAWFGLYGLMLLMTRPRSIRALPATQDLGGEPPAVASLLTNGWEVTEDAAESTLLDLGARRVLEFRQPANDPTHTTVHIAQNNPTGLTPYERRVFERVAGLAVGGLVPLTALTFRDQRKAQTWWKHLRAEVIADARTRGLARRRFSPAIVATLVAAGGLAGLGIAAALARYLTRTHEDDPWGTALMFGFFAFLLLAAWSAKSVGVRDTPAGREVAGHWFGVQAWLRGHEAFAELPPSAVAVWDRYLAYGAAVGCTRVSSAVIDLGMGNRKRVWSSFGGTWHRVKVRYPRFGAKYGKTAPRLLTRALVAGGIGYVLVRWWPGLIENASSAKLLQGNPALNFTSLIRLAGLALGAALLGYALYQLVRVAIDLITPVTLTGQVLWIQVWQETSGGDNSPPQPTLYYLAIDDGTGEKTTAWACPAALYRQCEVGDTVTATARRWSRRVLSITMVERGSPGHLAGAHETDPVDPDNLITAMLGSGGTSGSRTLDTAVVPATLLTAEEASQALGIPVTRLDTALPGPVGMVQFSSTDRNRVVLLLQVVDGTMGRLAWRGNSRGDQVAGIGDGALTKGDRAAARVGDTTVILTLVGSAKGRRQGLPWLLQQAVSRIPT